MQVSLVSALLFSIEDTGDKLVKIVADLLRSVVWRNLIDSQHLKQRKDLQAATTVTSQVKLCQIPVETTGLKESDPNANETNQRAQAYE